MKTSNELLNSITRVVSKSLNNGFFSIEAELATGERLILLPKSKRQPKFAQLFEMRANGNCRNNSYGKFFTFSKATKNIMYPSKHLKSYEVKQ